MKGFNANLCGQTQAVIRCNQLMTDKGVNDGECPGTLLPELFCAIGRNSIITPAINPIAEDIQIKLFFPIFDTILPAKGIKTTYEP